MLLMIFEMFEHGSYLIATIPIRGNSFACISFWRLGKVENMVQVLREAVEGRMFSFMFLEASAINSDV